MGQIFHPSTNTIAKASIVGTLFVLGAVACAATVMARSPYYTKQGDTRVQPVPFSHEHHYGGLGIDCRYCHTTVEKSSYAGMPATKVCMTCHSQIWTEAPMLAPVRASWGSSVSLKWTRVHNLPYYVYFNHSIHVAKGVGCVTCHGQVDQMPLMYKANSLLMRWCLECHRDPEKFIRPPEQVFNLAWHPDGDHTDAEKASMQARFGVDGSNQLELGAKLVEFYGINKPQLLNCSVCHR